MTEQDWLTSEDPARMLEWIRLGNIAAEDDYPPNYPHCPEKVSDRKLQRWCVALADRSYEPDSRSAINYRQWDQGRVKCDALSLAMFWAVDNDHDNEPTLAVKATLLRDIVGNPFREQPAVRQRLSCACGSAWTPLKKDMLPLLSGCLKCGRDGPFWEDVVKGEAVSWLTPAVAGIAETLYQERTFDELPILADALEEAGCDNAEILQHLRQQYRVRYEFAGATGGKNGLRTLQEAEVTAKELHDHFHGYANVWIVSPVHVRGCWAIDLLTGRT